MDYLDHHLPLPELGSYVPSDTSKALPPEPAAPVSEPKPAPEAAPKPGTKPAPKAPAADRPPIKLPPVPAYFTVLPIIASALTLYIQVTRDPHPLPLVILEVITVLTLVPYSVLLLGYDPSKAGDVAINGFPLCVTLLALDGGHRGVFWFFLFLLFILYRGWWELYYYAFERQTTFYPQAVYTAAAVLMAYISDQSPVQWLARVFLFTSLLTIPMGQITALSGETDSRKLRCIVLWFADLFLLIHLFRR